MLIKVNVFNRIGVIDMMEHKSYYPKTRLTEYATKISELIFGLFLFAAGAYLMVQANIGLSSWWALDIGIANLTGIDY